MFRNQLYLLFFLLLYACGSDKSAEQKNTQKVFHYNQPNAITSLDPAFAKSQTNLWAVDHLYNGLVQLDESLNIQPAIAKNWTISDDGLTYTFHLRDDVYFHNDPAFPDTKGRKVNATDFVYSFNRIIDNTVGSPGSWIFKGRIADNSPFKAIDEHTFQVTLVKPFRPMLGIFTMQYCSVVPKEAIDKYGKDFRSHAVGTGPFKFKKWIENQAMFLSKNENYWEKDNKGQALPYLDAVKISFVADRKTAYLEFSNQKLDYMSGIEVSFVDELLTKEGQLQTNKSSQVNFLKTPYLNMEYLGINLAMSASPLNKKKLRQALNYGFDRALMLKTLRNNVGKPATSGFTPIGLPSFNAERVSGYNYNPDKARKLLVEAGYPNGKGLDKITLFTNQDYVDVCNFITRQWEELGIKVQIELLESANLRNRMTKGTAPFFRASWIADYPDAESFFTVFYSKNPAPPNYTRFKNDTFDKLYEATLKENDDATRNQLYQQMDKILIEEAPVIFLFYDETAVFTQKNISGISKNAINLLSLKKVKK